MNLLSMLTVMNSKLSTHNWLHHWCM